MPWIPDISTARGPLYLAIAEAIADGIGAGRLAAGERLPSQRSLASQLGVDLTTVTRAYAEAARRGLVDSEDRRGSFVRASPVAQDDPVEAALASVMNMPPEPADDLLRTAMAEGLDAILDETGGAALHYRPSGGAEADRAAGAAFLSRLIPGTAPDQVVAAAGAQNALHAVCGLLLRDGGALGVGEFTYSVLLSVARRLGARVVPLRMDQEGILPEALEDAARTQALTAVYLIPTNDNPTTATMGPARRAAIAEVAARHGLAIIEDDAYGRLPETPLAPIAAMAPERTWHIAGLSKAVSPGLRVAWVRAPAVRDALALGADLHETAIMPPPLSLALVRRWQADGMLVRLIEAVRREGMARRRLAEGLFGGQARFQREGYHLWLPLAGGVRAADLATAGLPVVTGATFAADGRGPYEALRISLGGARSRERTGRDLRRLDGLIAGAARRGRTLV